MNQFRYSLMLICVNSGRFYCSLYNQLCAYVYVCVTHVVTFFSNWTPYQIETITTKQMHHLKLDA